MISKLTVKERKKRNHERIYSKEGKLYSPVQSTPDETEYLPHIVWAMRVPLNREANSERYSTGDMVSELET